MFIIASNAINSLLHHWLFRCWTVTYYEPLWYELHLFLIILILLCHFSMFFVHCGLYQSNSLDNCITDQSHVQTRRITTLNMACGSYVSYLFCAYHQFYNDRPLDSDVIRFLRIFFDIRLTRHLIPGGLWLYEVNWHCM